MVEETSQTPAAHHSHHQSNVKPVTHCLDCLITGCRLHVFLYLYPLSSGSFVWQKQDTSGWSQGLEQSTNQINTSSSGYSQRVIPVTSQVTHGATASSFQIPPVSFDLGNEWDDWSDFDDEKLVRAAQTSYEPDPQIRKKHENKTPGEA